MNTRKRTIRVQLTCALLCRISAAHAQDKPNIVLVFMDKFGWGEPGFSQVNNHTVTASPIT